MPLISTLTTGVSALRSFSKGLEVIGNNIANVNTTGFKSSSVSFADTFSDTLRASAPSTGTTSDQSAVQVGTGVQVASIKASFTQGALTSTGNTTDLGISGNGFFIVKDGSGNQFATRDGEFRIDDKGYIVTSDGYKVQGLTGGSQATPVTDASTVGNLQIGQNIPTGLQLKSVSIDTGGNVLESYSDGTTAATNRVLLQNFSDPSALMKQGSSLYTGLQAAGPISGSSGLVLGDVTNGSNDPGKNGLGLVQSGTLEQSNVDLAQQFSDLITIQRSFQAGSRLITVSDTVLEDIVNLKQR
jgi:flagellar hook protein FlgE